MNCQNCNSKLAEGVKFCLDCGAPVATNSSAESLSSPKPNFENGESQILSPDQAPMPDEVDIEIPKIQSAKKLSEKIPETGNPSGARSFNVAWVLATFFGFLGADRFYLGHIGTGVLKLIGFGWYGIWWLLDLMRINKGAQKDSNGEQLADPDNFIAKARVISAVVIPIVLIFSLLTLIAVIVGLLSPSTT
jgi:hypothetical protein